MAYREVTMLEVKEVLRLWLGGVRKKRIAAQLGLNIKTVRRYLSAAHAHGLVTVHEDERYIRGVVGRLTKRHESSLPRPWRMSESSPAFIAEMLTAIVGLEIVITRLVGKFKLSQNKNLPDALGAAHALKDRGSDAVAEAMLERVADRSDDASS